MTNHFVFIVGASTAGGPTYTPSPIPKNDDAAGLMHPTRLAGYVLFIASCRARYFGAVDVGCQVFPHHTHTHGNNSGHVQCNQSQATLAS